MRSGRFQWEALPAELLELVMRRLLSPEFCTLSSMKAALALAGCCKGMNGLFDDTRRSLRDVFFELDVVSWQLGTSSLVRTSNDREPGEECPYKVGFRVKWGIDSSCRRPDAKCPIDFHVLVALKGGWDGASNPPHHMVVDRSVTSLGERGYVIGGKHYSAEPGQIVIQHDGTELPPPRRRGFVRQVVVKSDPLVAFFAS